MYLAGSVIPAISHAAALLPLYAVYARLGSDLRLRADAKGVPAGVPTQSLTAPSSSLYSVYGGYSPPLARRLSSSRSVDPGKPYRVN